MINFFFHIFPFQYFLKTIIVIVVIVILLVFPWLKYSTWLSCLSLAILTNRAKQLTPSAYNKDAILKTTKALTTFLSLLLFHLSLSLSSLSPSPSLSLSLSHTHTHTQTDLLNIFCVFSNSHVTCRCLPLLLNK